MFFVWEFFRFPSAIFFDTIIVSRHCLKFLSRRICSYWMNGAFVKIIFVSGFDGIIAPAACTFFH